jgi:hypothetical protein
MKRILAITAVAFIFAGCNPESQEQPKPKVLDFESATVVAGPTIACENFYEDYTAGPLYTGYTDAATGLKVDFTGTVSESEWGISKYWNGVAVSAFTDKTTAGLANQCSVYGTGGADGSKNFAVSYNGTVAFADGATEVAFDHVWITNTTYAALSMRDGDAFAKKFEFGTPEKEGDWFLLTITGKDKIGKETGTPVTFYLADMRTTSSPGIVTEWTKVDLTPLGDKVHSLEFALSSSDNSTYDGGETYYMNTPEYFCFDNLAFYK